MHAPRQRNPHDSQAPPSHPHSLLHIPPSSTPHHPPVNSQRTTTARHWWAPPTNVCATATQTPPDRRVPSPTPRATTSLCPTEKHRRLPRRRCRHRVTASPSPRCSPSFVLSSRCPTALRRHHHRPHPPRRRRLRRWNPRRAASGRCRRLTASRGRTRRGQRIVGDRFRRLRFRRRRRHQLHQRYYSRCRCCLWRRRSSTEWTRALPRVQRWWNGPES